MKSLVIKACLFSLSLTVLAVGANAQRSSKKKTAQQNSGDQSQQQNNVAKPPPSGYNPYGNIPIEKDSSGVGYNDSVIKKSWKTTDAFDKSFVNDRTPLPYEHLRWDDALYTE